MSKSQKAKGKAKELDYDADNNPNLASYGDTTYKMGELLRDGIIFISSLKNKILKMNMNQMNVNASKSQIFIRLLRDRKLSLIMAWYVGLLLMLIYQLAPLLIFFA